MSLREKPAPDGNALFQRRSWLPALRSGWLRAAAGAFLVGTSPLSAGAACLVVGPRPMALLQGPASAAEPSPEQQADELAIRLNLSPKQKQNVTAILTNRTRQLEALRNSGGGNHKFRSNLRRLESLTDSYMQTVLPLQQYNQYYALKYPPTSHQRQKRAKGT